VGASRLRVNTETNRNPALNVSTLSNLCQLNPSS